MSSNVTHAVLVSAVLLAVLPQPAALAQDFAALKAEYRRPAGLPPAAVDNPASVRLGWELFQDRRLSRDATLGCVDCHRPELGWHDGLARARGQGGRSLGRRTPALLDLGWSQAFFWDGRASSLEAQTMMSIQASDEMNQSLDIMSERLSGVPFYRELFARAFPEAPTISPENIGRAIAAFQRTIVSGTSPFDRWIEGDEMAIGPAAKRGFVLFTGKARCANCHSGWRLTDNSFHDVGLPAGPDRGRGTVIAVSSLDYAFKTPSLRNVARRGPYMHDGSVETLRAAVDRYADGIVDRVTLSSDLKRISLTATEREDLVAVLEALSSDETDQSARYSPFR